MLIDSAFARNFCKGGTVCDVKEILLMIMRKKLSKALSAVEIIYVKAFVVRVT